jgi:hypothetical protein
MTLLTGAIAACALYQGARAVLAFRAAQTRDDVEAANLRALSAIAFASLGSGEALRYVGIVLFAVLLLAYAIGRVRAAPRLRASSASSATMSITEPSITA